MRIEQADIAHMSDAELKRLVVSMDSRMDLTTPTTGRDEFWRRLAIAVMRAVRERRTTFLIAEAEVMNGDGVGYLVGDDDEDPVAEMLVEFRRAVRGDVGDVL